MKESGSAGTELLICLSDTIRKSLLECAYRKLISLIVCQFKSQTRLRHGAPQLAPVQIALSSN
jgi:hypothetical protein